MSVKPYDIQRGTIRNGYAADSRYSHAVDNDYMGSSEFEWGALPTSLRRLQEERTDLTMLAAPEVTDSTGRALLLYGNFTRHDPVAYREMIRAVAHGEARTREFTGFGDHLGKGSMRRSTRVTNVWWDINNDVFMSFESDFIADLPRILKNSWDYMDAKQLTEGR